MLTEGRQQEGVLLVLSPVDGPATGAVVASENEVDELTTAQVDEVADAVTRAGLRVGHRGGLGEYRVYAYQMQNYVVVVGLPLSEVQQTITQIITAVLLVTAAGLLLLGIAIALVVRAGLAPLRAVADTATRVASLPMSEGAVSIDERVPDDEADERTEIGRVGHALNTLLDHVDASLDERQRNEERMRRFVADASHELRTPLASIRGYSELSLKSLRQAEASGMPLEGTIDTTGESLERIQAQSLRMTTLVEDLLLLARLDEGQELVYSTRRPHPPRDRGGRGRPARRTRPRLEARRRRGARRHRGRCEPPAPGRREPSRQRPHAHARRDDGDRHRDARGHGMPCCACTTTDRGSIPALRDELFERFSRADRSRARKTGGTGSDCRS